MIGLRFSCDYLPIITSVLASLCYSVISHIFQLLVRNLFNFPSQYFSSTFLQSTLRTSSLTTASSTQIPSTLRASYFSTLAFYTFVLNSYTLSIVRLESSQTTPCTDRSQRNACIPPRPPAQVPPALAKRALPVLRPPRSDPRSHLHGGLRCTGTYRSLPPATRQSNPP
jgi:hypothetical protein